MARRFRLAGRLADDGKRSLALDVPWESNFFIGGKESEERGWLGVGGSREGGRISV